MALALLVRTKAGIKPGPTRALRIFMSKFSWRVGGILRRDFRNDKSGPEIGAPRSSKDTKKWCLGKVGRDHERYWVKRKKYEILILWDFKCKNCGKVFETWHDSNYFKRQKPKGVELAEREATNVK